MDYIELTCEIEPFEQIISEILIARLSEMGFESFMEGDSGITAYIQSHLFKPKLFEKITKISIDNTQIEYKQNLIKDQNWNETWEKNYFKPILIAEKCLIRSTFHKNLHKTKFEILIDPKMSFGTGHHETTFLMIEEILELDLHGKTVLDMGCGTGILAILSSQKGAKDICAIDIDEWSYKNSQENIKLNAIKNVTVQLGDKRLIGNRYYNIIYANINKNILIADIPSYAAIIHQGGKLLLSGFYKEDFDDINKIAIENGLQLINQRGKNNWQMLSYLKVN
ncbi:MAG: 50S ribosomal protein L11 methyltransferase [Bacteroidetes bacterium]|nr:MAG: 50S ribosomal protein L11 methyltransferase [Bacteroidota bacterium]